VAADAIIARNIGEDKLKCPLNKL